MKLSNLTLDEIWSIVKKIKREVSLDKLCPKRTIYNRQKPYPVLSVLEEQLGIESSDMIFENITTNMLKNAAQIFIYLKGCPAEKDKETMQWYSLWNSFYTDLFNTKNPQQIILTLNRMTKSNSNDYKDGKIRAEKLLKKIATLLPLQYEHIQKKLPRRGKYNCSASYKEAKSLNHKGLHFLFLYNFLNF